MFRVSRKNQRLWHRVQPLLPGRHHVRSIITLPPGQAESARDKSYLTWANLLLGALIPLSIGIGTVVITVLQQHIDTRHQNQERELDDRRYRLDQLLANLSRQQDLEIDNRRYLLDQLLANLTRAQDLEIDQLRRDQDLKLDELRRKQDQELDDRRYNLEEEQTDKLRYQTIFTGFVDDISNILYKSQNNQSTFKTETLRLKYIRRKTLVLLRQLDGDFKGQVIRFLYDNELLADYPAEGTTVALLQGADLSDMVITDLIGREKRDKCEPQNRPTASFENLTFLSVVLTNALFIRCCFYDLQVNSSTMNNITFNSIIGGKNTVANIFSGNIMDYSNFQHSNLRDTKFIASNMQYSNFDQAKLQFVEFGEDFYKNLKYYEAPNGETLLLAHATFRKAILTITKFYNVDLSYSNFSGAQLHGVVFFANTNLSYSDFSQVRFLKRVDFINVNLSGCNIDLSSTLVGFGNVVLPNGTWTNEDFNMVQDGGAETVGELMNAVKKIAVEIELFIAKRINLMKGCGFTGKCVYCLKASFLQSIHVLVAKEYFINSRKN
jgi:uncharacterized protein YjbI with pentapeptide repeats